MDLDGHLLALIAPAAPGDDLAPGVRLTGVSSEVGWRLTTSVDGFEVDLEIERLDAGRPHAVATHRLAVSYRLIRGRSGPSADRLRAVCAALAARIAAREDEVLDAIARDAERGPGAGERIREVRVTRLLERVSGAPTALFGLSPYVGCLIGCRFCYAQSRLRSVRRLMLVDDVPWGSYVDVRVNAPELLADELGRHAVDAIKFCPIVSDPYQAVEQRYRLTRRCLEVLRDDGRPRTVLVLTRSATVLQDAALLGSIDGAYVGVSLPTVDDSVRRHFEPRGASIPERLDVLAQLASHGVRTFAMVQPLLPGPVDALADALASVVRSVRIDVLRGVEGATQEFADSRYAEARDDAWQARRADALATALRERGVALWSDELPPR